MASGRSVAGAAQRRSFLSIPAIQALLIQVLSCVLVVAAAFGLAALDAPQPALLHAALLQGTLAAALSRWRRQAPWWWLIHFVFPVALLALHALRLPPAIFLSAFLLFVVLFWSTFRTQVPYYPSTPAVWDAVAALLPPHRPLRVIDVGSGFGGLVMRLARQRPDGEFLGIELAPLPLLVSRLRSHFGRSGGRFLHGDYHSLDFSQFDVVFAYLSPAAMPALWRKAEAEMRPGALLLSYEFVIPEVEPHVVRKCAPGGPLLYGWYLKFSPAGS